jgi:hypothetical protein
MFDLKNFTCKTEISLWSWSCLKVKQNDTNFFFTSSASVKL